MATRRELIEQAKEILSSASVPATPREIEWLLLGAESISSVELFSNPNVEVSEIVAQVFEAFVRRRLTREPVQYILGFTEFYGLRFAVNPSVLIPRPETELLVERALDQIATAKGPVVVDIGTGSGCIAISIKHARPDAHVTGIDLSAGALDVARENADALNTPVTWLEDDIYSDTISDRVRQVTLSGKVDLLVSNPPYVTPNEKEAIEPEVYMHEPSEALFADASGLNPYRALAQLGFDILSETGMLLVEIHSDAGRRIEDVFAEAGYGRIERHRDLTGKDRIVSARIRV
ncbi:MAG: peptide chain release factor N(5)-glutamine methyltransferase [Rhodothermia bacterium]|nr:MAG: peptide chain release factor N(5)-glutamine methyltransferase [Rhodothermia bacterium]